MSYEIRILEVHAMRAEFASLCDRWALKEPEARAILETDPVPGGEAAMRLLLELDYVMRGLVGSEEVASWLRDPDPSGLSPLTFLTQGHDERRAMLAASRLRYRQIVGTEP